MVKVSGSALAAQFDSPAKRRAPRRTAARRHAQGATAGGATAVCCAMDSGGVARESRKRRHDGNADCTSSQKYVCARWVSAKTFFCADSGRDCSGKQSAAEKCSREPPRLIEHGVAETPQTRRRVAIASHASAEAVFGRSLSHTPARLPRLRALARHTPRRSFVRTRRPRLHLGAGNSSIRRVRAREGFRCIPRGSGHCGHREKTRRRRSRGASTLNRRARSSCREAPLL